MTAQRQTVAVVAPVAPLAIIPPTPTHADPTTGIISPPTVRFQATNGGIGLVPVPTPAPPPTPSNPFPPGSIKHLASAIPPVTPSTLLPYSEFHSGNFTVNGEKEKLLNLSAHHSCQAFASICLSDSRMKILHSVWMYVAPLGKEGVMVTTGNFSVSKGVIPRGAIPNSFILRQIR